MRGMYVLGIGDLHKCVEENRSLVTGYSGDSCGHANLAICLSHLHEYGAAVVEIRRAIELTQRSVIFRYDLSAQLSYTGDFEAAEREALIVRQLNPAHGDGALLLAYAELGQGRVARAAATLHEFAALGTREASIA